MCSKKEFQNQCEEYCVTALFSSDTLDGLLSKMERVRHPRYTSAQLDIGNIDFQRANDIFERCKQLGVSDIGFDRVCMHRLIAIWVSCFHFAATTRAI